MLEDIENIIYNYYLQLKLKDLNKDFLENISVNIYSKHFSEYIYKNNKIVNYYQKRDKLLLTFRNNNPTKNCIDVSTIVKILH